MIWYPTEEDIIEINKFAVTVNPTKKDKHKVLSNRKIREAIFESVMTKGSIEKKSAVLMKEINQKHPFASGNKRSAFLAANRMILNNKGWGLLKKHEDVGQISKQIRARKLSVNKIAKFLGEK